MVKRKENKMFRRARGWRPSRVEPAPPQFIGLGWAYRESARALFVATHSDLNSFSAFPLVFLYRQAIELFLKGIRIDLGWNWGIDRQQVIDRKHDLAKQISDLEIVARCAGLKVSARLKRHVGQLNGIDPKAIAFRFPENRLGKPALTAEEESFDVEQFVSSAEDVLDDLKSLADDLNAQVYQAFLRVEGIPVDYI